MGYRELQFTSGWEIDNDNYPFIVLTKSRASSRGKTWKTSVIHL